MFPDGTEVYKATQSGSPLEQTLAPDYNAMLMPPNQGETTL